MFENDGGTLLSIAAVVSACCAILAAWVSLAVWRQARTGDYSRLISDGDARVKAHADAAYADLRETVDDMRDTLGRIESHQTADEKHVLRPRDLMPLHEKINRVAEDVAAIRAQATTETRMLSEQLRILQRLVQESGQRSRSL